MTTLDAGTVLRALTGQATAPAITTTSATTTATTTAPRITLARLEECERSATRWATELPRYADHQQRRADRFAISAGIIAAVTGMSIYPVVDNVENLWVRYALAIPAIVAAVLAVFPQVKNYGEMAGRARELSSVYGPLKGALVDAVGSYADVSDETLRAIMDDFDAAKMKKDQLRDLPPPSTSGR